MSKRTQKDALFMSRDILPERDIYKLGSSHRHPQVCVCLVPPTALAPLYGLHPCRCARAPSVSITHDIIKHCIINLKRIFHN